MGRYTKRWTFPVRYPDGRQETVVVTTEVRPGGSPAAPGQAVEGRAELRTAQGHRVESLRKGEYRDTETGELLTSDAPHAYDPGA